MTSLKKRKRKDIENEDNVFEVDAILDTRLRGGVVEYLTAWLGHSDDAANTWEPGAPVLVQPGFNYVVLVLNSV